MRRAVLVAFLALDVLRAQQSVQIPPPRGMVNDFANVIPAAQAARMERLAQYVRERSKGEITVVTLATIGGRDVGEMALEIGRAWKVGADAKIGDASRNAGTVILLVPKETSPDGKGYITITTGQGTEGFITDGIAGDIRREATPLLAQRRYGDGLELITLRVAERYAAAFGFALDSTASVFRPQQPDERSQPRNQSRGQTYGGRSIVSWAITAFVILLFLFSGMRGGAGRSGCLWFLLGNMLGGGRGGGGFGGGFGGGGGGGGGFGGFGGGGGFSGGGSSGSF